MKRRGIMVAVCVLAIMVLAPWAHGQAPAEKSVGPSADKWEFSVTPYFWAVQIDSRVTVKGHSAESNTYFSDIFNNLNGAALVHMEAWKGGTWGLFTDINYLKIRDDGEYRRAHALRPNPPTRDLTLTTESWIVEFGGMYMLGKWPMGEKSQQAVSVAALGGGRYWYMSVDLDTTSPIHPSDNNQWVDPFIGAVMKVDFTKQFSFILRGDIGGFGVGSDISYNAFGLFGYNFTPKVMGLFGYRLLYIDYKKSSGDTRYKETFMGPIAGLTIVF